MLPRAARSSELAGTQFNVKPESRQAGQVLKEDMVPVRSPRSQGPSRTPGRTRRGQSTGPAEQTCAAAAAPERGRRCAEFQLYRDVCRRFLNSLPLVYTLSVFSSFRFFVLIFILLERERGGKAPSISRCSPQRLLTAAAAAGCSRAGRPPLPGGHCPPPPGCV